MRDPALRGSVLPVAAEVHQTLVVAQLLEVLVVVSYYAIAQVFHHTCGQGEGFRELLFERQLWPGDVKSQNATKAS